MSSACLPPHPAVAYLFLVRSFPTHMKTPHIRSITSGILCCGALMLLVWSRVFAEPSDSASRIKPESIVRFTQGGIVSLTQDALLEITLHSMNGEKPKVAAIQISPHNP